MDSNKGKNLYEKYKKHVDNYANFKIIGAEVNKYGAACF